MRILVAGGTGYIGSVLVPVLLERGHEVRVLDRCYFGDSLAGIADPKLTVIRSDTRCFEPKWLDGCDAVVDLAGISNDPSCELEPEFTKSVNFDGGKRLAALAQEIGVRRYVYASSCSVYGHGEALGLTETSERRPVSLYARSKVALEDELMGRKGRSFEPVLLRFATVFGLSPRMRFDLAVNVMTKNAYVSRQITVDGGGKQWRPFVHVRDVSEAIVRALETDAKIVSGEVFNVGASENNVQILSLAYWVRDAIPGTEVHLAPTDPDARNYNVSFEKIERVLGFKAERNIAFGIDEVLRALKTGKLDPDDRRHYTLKQYAFLREAERAHRELSVNGQLLSAP